MFPRHTPEQENGTSDTLRSDTEYNGLTSDEVVQDIIENPDEEGLSPEMQAVLRGAAEEVDDLDIE